MTLLPTLLQTLFPQRCPLCNVFRAEGLFCPSCAAALPPLIRERCPRCGAPEPNNQLCGACLQSPPPYTKGISLFPFLGSIAQGIRLGKYGHHPWIFSRLGSCLAPIATALAPTRIVPIPTSRRAYLKRGFSQTVRLAKGICAELEHPPPLDLRCLTRHATASPQAALSRKERLKLPPETFSCTPLSSWERILLVDDVYTTGATVRAAALALTRTSPGVEVVWVTLARTL